MKEILISRDAFETRVALIEDGRPAELYLERPSHPTRVGNIYKGRVENVLAGMEAAFVDIGLDRNGYLSREDVAGAGAGGRRKKITELLHSGDEILVQITRDGMGAKGPRLSTQLSLAGRYVVFMPEGRNTGASRRLCDTERERLREVCRTLAAEGGGLIARTVAEGAGEEAIGRDLRFLRKVWSGVARRAGAAQAACLVYTEVELALRAVRDLSGPEVGRVLVDDEHLRRRVVNYLRAIAPEFASSVRSYDEPRPLFDRYGLDGVTRKALRRRVELPSGGYLVIDPTEAMTVIDVNTGRYVGKRVLEETTLKTNLEACREVIRQLRLRDIGGIIVIDFIDMSSEANREAVLAALRAESAADRTKTYVVALSPLGLVEMTRQNLTAGLRDIITAPCPTCRGEGRVLSEESAAIEVQRRLTELARTSPTQGVRVAVHPRMASLLQTGTPSVLTRIAAQTGHFVLLSTAQEDVPLDHVSIAAD